MHTFPATPDGITNRLTYELLAHGVDECEVDQATYRGEECFAPRSREDVGDGFPCSYCGMVQFVYVNAERYRLWPFVTIADQLWRLHMAEEAHARGREASALNDAMVVAHHELDFEPDSVSRQVAVERLRLLREMAELEVKRARAHRNCFWTLMEMALSNLVPVGHVVSVRDADAYIAAHPDDTYADLSDDDSHRCVVTDDPGGMRPFMAALFPMLISTDVDDGPETLSS